MATRGWIEQYMHNDYSSLESLAVKTQYLTELWVALHPVDQREQVARGTNSGFYADFGARASRTDAEATVVINRMSSWIRIALAVKTQEECIEARNVVRRRMPHQFGRISV